MYRTWNQSQIEPLEARSRQLLLKSCKQCFIVYQRSTSHVCNVSSRERIHEEAKKFNEEGMLRSIQDIEQHPNMQRKGTDD